jgi:hypothetical protein
MGDGPPPTGGNLCPHHHEVKERPWNWSPRRAWNCPPPGRLKRCQRAPRRCQQARRRYPPTLKEEEAGILQFEVSSVSPHAPSISRGSCSPFTFFLLSG